MALTLKKEYFNPLYFIINDLIRIPTIRTVLIYGGKSSSKTISICQALAKECYVKAANTIAFRKESAIIPTTLKKSFNLAIDSTRLYPAFEKQDRRYLCQNQGGWKSEIVMKGLDDPEKAKGTESYKYIYLDELNHFEQSEYEQFNLSLRGIAGQKIFAAWNPVDENSWVKTALVDTYTWLDMGAPCPQAAQPSDWHGWKLPCENSFVQISACGKVVLIKTTYEDNYWIVGSPGYAVNEDGKLVSGYGYRDENLIAEYEGLAAKNNNSYKVNVLGEWGKTTYGGEFLKCWKSEVHTGIVPYDKDLAVYLIFDENVSPYFPCLIFQIGDNNNGYERDIRIIACLSPENPNNTVTYMCTAVMRKLKEWQHTGEVFVGGDPTSQKADVKQEQGHDLFKLLMNGLTEFKPRRAVLQSSPSVKISKEFVNNILEAEVFGLRIRVDKSCRKAILDFENTKEDKNGNVDKTPVRNPITKVTYQPYGHYNDCLRYMIVQAFDKEYRLYQNRMMLLPGGTAQVPRTGFRRLG